MSAVGDADLIVGVGTHLDTHTAAICDDRGRVLAQLQVVATAAGYGELLAWAQTTPRAGNWRGRWKAHVITGWAGI